MKIYISGKMSGLPNHNYPAFFDAQKQLENLGHETVNPAELGFVDGWSWEDYMRRDIELLMKCDSVAVLSSWRSSKGAQLEVYIADQLNMPVYSLEELILN